MESIVDGNGEGEEEQEEVFSINVVGFVEGTGVLLILT